MRHGKTASSNRGRNLLVFRSFISSSLSQLSKLDHQGKPGLQAEPGPAPKPDPEPMMAGGGGGLGEMLPASLTVHSLSFHPERPELLTAARGDMFIW